MIFGSPFAQRTILALKREVYGRRGEPFTAGTHKLRYIPGTRPTRIRYSEATDATVRNDAKQVRLLVDKVRPGEFVIDVGGNVGQYAVLLGALVGAKGRVITFEPSSDARQLLERNIALNAFSDRITIEPIALFDAEGSHDFFTRGADSMASLERAGFGTAAESDDIQRTTVRTTTLDAYIAGRVLDRPAWIKIDAEGAEINILRGAVRTLESGARVVCELHPYAWPSFGVTFDDLRSIVAQAGKTMTSLDDTSASLSAPTYGSVIIE
jgi:FkbM family methyltransferase